MKPYDWQSEPGDLAEDDSLGVAEVAALIVMAAAGLVALIVLLG